MEHDFFRYLVIIIFIIGALRSLFKKRPAQEPVKRPQIPDPWNSPPPVKTPSEEVDTEGDDLAVQREIAKMFGKEIPDSMSSPSLSSQRKLGSPELTDSASLSSQRLPAVEGKLGSLGYGESAYAVSIPVGYSEEIKKEPGGEITLLLEKKTKTEEAARRFRESIKEKLYHPESLKDYIVISEILGKPKAFE